MKRQEVDLLQHISGYPALTITLPTQRTSPGNRQDPIRMHNLVHQAENRLLTEFNKHDAAQVIDRLEKLVQEIDFRHTLDGLALFVNPDFARAIQLPFTLKERVHVGKTFVTRDLVFAMNRTPHYWVLVLSEKPTRLYEAAQDELSEIHTGGFPITHEGPGGEQPLPGGFGIKKSAYRDEYHRKFFRQIDTQLGAFLAERPLPLVVVGVVRFLAFFNEVTRHKESIVTTLQGSHDKTSAHELGRLIWPQVREAFAAQRKQALAALAKAVSERRSVSTVGEVWRFAHKGRGHLLLVEKDFRYPATIDETGRFLSPAEDTNALDANDAVDAIIEMVLNAHGQVVFLENGQLEAHQRIALILRD